MTIDRAIFIEVHDKFKQTNYGEEPAVLQARQWRINIPISQECMGGWWVNQRNEYSTLDLEVKHRRK